MILDVDEGIMLAFAFMAGAIAARKCKKKPKSDKPPADKYFTTDGQIVSICSYCGAKTKELADKRRYADIVPHGLDCTCELCEKEPADADFCPKCGVMPCVCNIEMKPADAGSGITHAKREDELKGAENSPTKPVRGASSRMLTLLLLENRSAGMPSEELLVRDFVLDEGKVPYVVEQIDRFLRREAKEWRGDSDE